jgi:hypothetical protein
LTSPRGAARRSRRLSRVSWTRRLPALGLEQLAAESERGRLLILKEQGSLATNDLAQVAALYDVKKANENACDFKDIRQKTLELVNRP